MKATTQNQKKILSLIHSMDDENWVLAFGLMDFGWPELKHKIVENQKRKGTEDVNDNHIQRKKIACFLIPQGVVFKNYKELKIDLFEEKIETLFPNIYRAGF